MKYGYCRDSVCWYLKGIKLSRGIGLAMLGMLILTVACNNGDRQQQDNSRASSATHCQSLQHDRGKTKVCGQPQKIVALGPNMLEMLLALDVRSVGYADYFPLPFSKFDRPSAAWLK